MANNYIYIQAIVKNDLKDGPGSIRFRHVVVTGALDEANAYQKGQEWSDKNPPHLEGYRPEEETINDLVISFRDF